LAVTSYLHPVIIPQSGYFEDPALTYEEAMLDFVAASQERANQAQRESQTHLAVVMSC
jgi:hypothetical protein